MSTQKESEEGVVNICHMFTDSIIFNNRSIVHFSNGERVICWSFFVDVIDGNNNVS